MNIMDLFKAVIIIQLFYSFAITGLTHALPADSLDYVTGFSDITDSINLETVSEDVQESIQRQTDIPVIEMGALVFYSGNILIDLMLNFAFAVPEMIGMLVNGIMILFLGIDSYLFAIVQLFASVVIIVVYFISLMQLLTSIRSGRTIT